MTNQTSAPTPPPTGQNPPESNRFFTWLRSLGIVRADGWLGGVCGGIAIRTGLDPLLVRGIVVVVAVLGGPAFLFYAAAWALLPDTQGRIHLERVFRGRIDTVIIGIGVLALLAFLPVAQGVWWAGDHLVGNAWWAGAPSSLLRLLWNLAVIGLIVWFIVWIVQKVRDSDRTGGRAPSGAPTAGTAQPTAAAAASSAPSAPSSADFGPSAFAATTAPEPPQTTARSTDTTAGSADGARPQAGETADAAPEVPAAPTAGASTDDMAEWRQRYAAWREQHAAWQEQQRAVQRTAREQRSAQIRSQSMALAVAAEDRRRLRKAANPRTSGWYVALTLGAALVIGGVAGLIAQGDDGLRAFAGTIGVAVAVVTVGVAMVIAGLLRRRAGFLAAVAIVLAVIGVGTFAWPTGSPSIGYGKVVADQDQRYNQFAGQIEIDAAAADVPAGQVRRIDVSQFAGAVAVYAAQGVPTRVEVTSRDSRIHAYTVRNGEMGWVDTSDVETSDDRDPITRSYDNTHGEPARLIVTVHQGHGGVYVYTGGSHPTSGIDIG